MSKFLKSDFGYISILIILFLCFLPAFFMHQGLLLIDTGREFYIPSRILAGEALFKDIFIIYGPFSYLFNAFIMKIFGQSLYSIYIAGLFNSLLIILFIYLISAQFIKKNLSFLIALISIFSLVYNTFLYNSNLPYTYAISYALSFFLISVFCLIKYTKSDNILFARIAAIFGGLSLICKYEFLILPFIMLYVLLFIKPAGVKNLLLSALLFLSPSLLCFTLIFLQGADVNNLFVNFSLLYKLITAPSLNIFFSKFPGKSIIKI